MTDSEKLDLILQKMESIETTMKGLSQPGAVLYSGNIGASAVAYYDCCKCGVSVEFGTNHICPQP